MTAFRLFVLGTAELRLQRPDGTHTAVPVHGKPLALLCRLAFSSTRTFSRDSLAEELWSELPVGRARAQLRNAIWTLRTHLGDATIRADESTVTLADPLSSDRTDFESAVSAAKRAAAVELFQGDFLAHFAVAGAQGFEEWADLDRRYLRGLFVASAEELARETARLGHTREAIAVARRVRDADPLRQEGWRLLFECLNAAGDSATLLGEASALTSLAIRDGLTLTDATRDAMRVAISASPSEGSKPEQTNLQADLIGRERELSQLFDSFDEATRGVSRAVIVSGAPGVGKTRLLSDFERALVARRRRVIALAAQRTTSRIPFATVARLVERLATMSGAAGVSEEVASILVGLSPALSSVYRRPGREGEGDDLRRSRLLAVIELIKAVAEDGTVVLLIDDVQWLDPSSREIIDAIAGLASDQPLLLVLSHRDQASDPPSIQDGRHLRLLPLGRDECEALVASIAAIPASQWSPDWIAALSKTSGGIPLALLDLLRLATERGAVVVHEGAWRTDDPAGLIELTREAAPRKARLAELPTDARQIVALCGVARGPLTSRIAAEVLLLNDSAFALAIDELTRRGIATITGDLVAVEHDEYGQSARESLTTTERDSLIHALVVALAASGRPDDLHRAFVSADDAGLAGDASRIARQYVAAVRVENRDRPVRDILADLLGIGARTDLLQRLATELEPASRLGRRAVLIAASIATVAVASAMLMYWNGRDLPKTPPDATLIALFDDSTGRVSYVPVPLWRDQWVTSKPIVIDVSRSLPLAAGPVKGLRQNPRTPTLWVGVRASSVTNADDLVLIEAGGKERLLVPGAGDDKSPAWSPDGRSVVFITNRWNGPTSLNLGIADVAAGTVRQLTTGPLLHGSPVFSPDGSQVLFERTSGDRQQNHICSVTVATGALACHVGLVANEKSLAWLDANTVALGTFDKKAARAAVNSLDIGDGSQQLVARCERTDAVHLLTSVLTVCGAQTDQAPATIAWLAQPSARRAVVFRNLAGRHFDGFVPAGTDHTPETRLAFQIRLRGHVAAGVPYQLRLVSIAADSLSSRLPRVEWSVSPSTAVIDTNGVLLVGQPGRVVVKAKSTTLTDSVVVDVVRSTSGTIGLDESWDQHWVRRWRIFGAPSPTIAESRGVRMFLNNNQGTYHSGAYSRHSFDASEGLALDAEVSTPIRGERWQVLQLMAWASSNAQAMERWDHKTGYAPWAGSNCFFAYPLSPEGPTWGTTFVLAAKDARVASTTMRSGQWYHVRLQIFPDGRCAGAIDGRALPGMLNDILPRGPFQVAVWGSSAGTQVAVRRLRVISGVPPDIDWSPVFGPKTAVRR